jgi:hypothetical protein
MSRVAIVLIALVALAFAVVNGALMFASPKHHAAFWRWYTRSGSQTSGFDSGAQIQLRIAGIVIVIFSTFFGWILAEKVLSR